MIAETPEITAALDLARQRWPEARAKPGVLLRNLVEEGARAVAVEQHAQIADRLARAKRAAGSLSDVLPDGYLERLRSEWPE